MSRLASLAGGVIFLIIAAIALYRLLFFFELTIGGHHVGQTASFLTFAACAAISLIMFRGAMVGRA